MNNTSTKLCSRISLFNAVFLIAVNFFIIFFGIILNSVVIMSLWNSQLRRKLCYFTILVLSCSDLAVVVVIQPMVTLEAASYWVSLNFARVVRFQYLYYSTILSFTAYLTMTLERYLALMHPFFHQKSVTKPRLMIAFVLFQLPFGVLYILDQIGLHWPFLISCGILGGFILVICILNIKLFFIAKTLRRRAAVQLGKFDGSISGPRNIDRKRFKVTLTSLRIISTCLLAVMCLIIFYVPWIVFFAIKNASDVDRFEYTFTTIDLWTETFANLNSTLNSLIFFYKNSLLRRHGQMFVKKCFSCRNLHANQI